MFIQVLKGNTSDPEGLKRQIERWNAELAPGATGFLGSTGGVTDDGTVIAFARFRDEAAAQANADRPEQTAWWNETEKYVEGATFLDTSDTEELGGGSDAAGFVQIMSGRVTDRARLTELEARLMPKMQELRPDVLGNVRAWKGNEYFEAIYFTNEAEAREGEKKMESAGIDMAEFEAISDGPMTFYDLKDPWLFTP